ncbi:MAG: ATP-dependent zinc protease [Bacteroidota bacterium]|jgi:hypothetical protein|nr:ATP-dependent zinc protease [Bacteroidota bacterium]MCA6443826.1 ATP-dependent zinc protease [Bacteroidota bacterium]
MHKTNQHILRLIGRREFVDFPEFGINAIEAKIDTGAYTNSLHCEKIEIVSHSAKAILRITIKLSETGLQKTKTIDFEEYTKKKIKNSFGELEERYVIKTLIKLGRKRIRTSISLSNRENMRYEVLIGRKMLKGKFLIDVNQIHLGGKKIVI